MIHQFLSNLDKVYHVFVNFHKIPINLDPLRARFYIDQIKQVITIEIIKDYLFFIVYILIKG